MRSDGPRDRNVIGRAGPLDALRHARLVSSTLTSGPSQHEANPYGPGRWDAR